MQKEILSEKIKKYLAAWLTFPYQKIILLPNLYNISNAETIPNQTKILVQNNEG